MSPLTEVIPPKLFLDAVLSYSEEVTRAMREQPKRLPRNYLRRNGGNVLFMTHFSITLKLNVHL